MVLWRRLVRWGSSLRLVRTMKSEGLSSWAMMIWVTDPLKFGWSAMCLTLVS